MSMMQQNEPMKIGHLVINADEFVAAFVKARIPYVSDFGPYRAIGVVCNDRFVGGVVYHGYRQRDRDIQVSLAFDTPRFAMRQTLRGLFSYPFIELGCARMTAFVPRSNKRSRRFCEGLGFKHEGVARKAIAGEDAFLFGMLRDECKWLKA